MAEQSRAHMGSPRPGPQWHSRAPWCRRGLSAGAGTPPGPLDQSRALSGSLQGRWMWAAGLRLPPPHSLLHFHPGKPNSGLYLPRLGHGSSHLPSLPIPTHQVFFLTTSLYSYCSPSLPDELLFTLQNPFSPKHSPTNLQQRPGPPSLQSPGHVWRPPPLPQAHPPFKPGQGPMDAPLESLSHP